MGELNFFSTMEDLIASSDEQIVREMGAVSPEVVMEYILYLRRKTSTSSQNFETNVQPPPYNPDYRDELAGSSREFADHTPAGITPYGAGVVTRRESSPGGLNRFKSEKGESSRSSSLRRPNGPVHEDIAYMNGYGDTQKLESDIQLDIHGTELKHLKDFVFERKLRVGDKIVAHGFLNARTTFSITFRTDIMRNVLQIQFDESGDMVMTGPDSLCTVYDSVEQKVPGQKYTMVIFCDTYAFRILIDGIEKKSFPYQTPLDELTGVWCQPRWVWSSVDLPQPFVTASKNRLGDSYPIKKPLQFMDKLEIMGKYAPVGSKPFAIYLKRQGARRGWDHMMADFFIALVGLLLDYYLRLDSPVRRRISAKHPPLDQGQLFLVEIVCDRDAFRVFFDGVEKGAFPYFDGTHHIKSIYLQHGGKRSGWFWVNSTTVQTLYNP
eukprot:sb/3464815/